MSDIPSILNDETAEAIQQLTTALTSSLSEINTTLSTNMSQISSSLSEVNSTLKSIDEKLGAMDNSSEMRYYVMDYIANNIDDADSQISKLLANKDTYKKKVESFAKKFKELVETFELA